jgi:DnaJ-class molecular chaperone
MFGKKKDPRAAIRRRMKDAEKELTRRDLTKAQRKFFEKQRDQADRALKEVAKSIEQQERTSARKTCPICRGNRAVGGGMTGEPFRSCTNCYGRGWV